MIDAARCIPLPCLAASPGAPQLAADWRNTSFPLSNTRKLPGTIPSLSTLMGADGVVEFAAADLVGTGFSAADVVTGALACEAPGTESPEMALAGCALTAVF